MTSTETLTLSDSRALGFDSLEGIPSLLLDEGVRVGLAWRSCISGCGYRWRLDVEYYGFASGEASSLEEARFELWAAYLDCRIGAKQ